VARRQIVLASRKRRSVCENLTFTMKGLSLRR
jgi:hypothetical protein